MKKVVQLKEFSTIKDVNTFLTCDWVEYVDLKVDYENDAFILIFKTELYGKG